MRSKRKRQRCGRPLVKEGRGSHKTLWCRAGEEVVQGVRRAVKEGVQKPRVDLGLLRRELRAKCKDRHVVCEGR